MSSSKAYARASRPPTLRIVPRLNDDFDPKEEPTLPISVETLRAMANDRVRDEDILESSPPRPPIKSGMRPPPLPEAARKLATSPSASTVRPLATTVVTRRPAAGHLVVSLWVAWLGAAGLFLGTAAIVLRIETRNPTSHVGAAAPSVVESSVVPVVELPRVVLPQENATPPQERAPAPAAVTAKAPAVPATHAPRSKPSSTTTKSLSVTTGGRGSEIVRSLDWGPTGYFPPATPAPAAPAAPPAPPKANPPSADSAQAVIKSADAELQAVVRAMH